MLNWSSASRKGSKKLLSGLIACGACLTLTSRTEARGMDTEIEERLAAMIDLVTSTTPPEIEKVLSWGSGGALWLCQYLPPHPYSRAGYSAGLE